MIDDVLTPLTTSHTATNEIYNPDALEFLTYAGSLDIGGHRVRLVGSMLPEQIAKRARFFFS